MKKKKDLIRHKIQEFLCYILFEKVYLMRSCRDFVNFLLYLQFTPFSGLEAKQSDLPHLLALLCKAYDTKSYFLLTDSGDIRKNISPKMLREFGNLDSALACFLQIKEFKRFLGIGKEDPFVACSLFRFKKCFKDFRKGYREELYIWNRYQVSSGITKLLNADIEALKNDFDYFEENAIGDNIRKFYLYLLVYDVFFENDVYCDDFSYDLYDVIHLIIKATMVNRGMDCNDVNTMIEYLFETGILNYREDYSQLRPRERLKREGEDKEDYLNDSIKTLFSDNYSIFEKVRDGADFSFGLLLERYAAYRFGQNRQMEEKVSKLMKANDMTSRLKKILIDYLWCTMAKRRVPYLDTYISGNEQIGFEGAPWVIELINLVKSMEL